MESGTMKNAQWVIVLGALVLSACAGAPHARKEASLMQTENTLNRSVASNDPSDRMICTWETPTGTHFKRKHCITPRQAEKQRADARRTYRRDFGRHGGRSCRSNC
jgi:hypothetical protein